MNIPLLSRVANPGDHIEITHPTGETTAGDFLKVFPPRGRKNGGVILWQPKQGGLPEDRKSSYKEVRVTVAKATTARIVR